TNAYGYEGIEGVGGGEVSRIGGVYHHRIAACVLDLAGAAVGAGLVLDEFADAVLEQVAHGRVERTHTQIDLGTLGDDVVHRAGRDAADADHRGEVGIDVAPDDGLQPEHGRRCGQRGIHRHVRH